MEALPLRALAAAALAAAAGVAPAASAADLFTKLLVDRDGVVRVTDRELAAAGARFPDGEVDRLSLTLRGKKVPILLRRLPAGSRDGRFDLRFVGSRPKGEKTWDDPYVDDSVYLLRGAPEGPAPARIPVSRAALTSPGAPAGLDASPHTVHFEENRKLIRFTGMAMPDEVWFWAEVKATDPAATRVPVKLDAVSSRGTFRLRVRMVGYSHLPASPDHTVDLTWNGEAIGHAEWDGESAHVFEKELPSAKLREGENALSVHALGAKTNGIDLVLLDWVEVTYPRRHRVTPAEPAELTVADGAAARIESPGELLVFAADGTRAWQLPVRGSRALFVAPGQEGGAPGGTPPRRYLAVAAEGGRPPRAVAVSRPADLTAKGLGADYVVVTHASLRAEAETLASARRAQGLASAVVDVADLYDRFNDGFLHPSAIRDFVKYAVETWKPAPRYVVLLGDASWDYKNAVVDDDDYADWHWAPQWAGGPPKNTSNVSGKKGLRNDRQLVPTWQYQSPWGHSASDNYFVAFGGADRPPDLAVGRIPSATPAEARAAVEKILEYERLAPAALKSALFITNDEEGFQRATDTLVDFAAKEGYDVHKVYPKKEEKENSANTRALLDAFDAGQAFVLFNGHGGRYIWRTGPPDLKKNHDLFTLDHLDQLEETEGLPVVVSLTCYSAPFDHPVADSIGEKMLRVKRKGAVAVLASSWRNAPPLELGRKMVELLGDPRFPRIGDAVVAAKKSAADPVSLATYNLLGDPATLYRGPVPALAPSPAAPAQNAEKDGTTDVAPSPSR